MKRIYKRFDELRSRYGLWRLPWRAMLRAFRAVRKVWRHLARNRQYVFAYQEGAPTLPGPDSLRVERYVREQDIPKEYTEQLVAEGISLLLPTWRRGFARHGVLWLGLIDGHVVAHQWTRLGMHIPRWYIPLRDEDVVIFAVGTLPRWRGRGICPAMMRHIIASEARGQGRAWVDCSEWNAPSIRAIEKAGFRRFAVKKPLPRGGA